jgi:O-acetyl-ADP-ribose deacetylase (regulator of RNase III)
MSVAIAVVPGDITRQPAKALITAINSGGMWFGGIDGAIMRVSGNMFHQQASMAQPLVDGQVVFAQSMDGHGGVFSNVIFVVDDLRQPLRNIVLAGLNEAERQGMTTVSLPTIRTGVMAGAVEPTVGAALAEMAAGICDFQASRPSSVTSVTVVVYNDSDSETYLRKLLGL